MVTCGSTLDTVQVAAFQNALAASAGYIDQFLDIVAGRLGLDHDRVLMGRYAFPVISRVLHQGEGRFADSAETGRALYWYIHSALWGRYGGSTETVLNQDYDTASQAGVSGLISSLERWRGGSLAIAGQDFAGSGRGSRFYPLLYLLTRMRGGLDFGTGLPPHSHLPGNPASVQLHHVFPKAVLYAAGYRKRQVNALANFCFLARETSLVIGERNPAEYFSAVEARHPGVLASQWIPQDPALWRVDRFPDFLEARRRLLAAEANDFLARLRSGSVAGSGQSLENQSLEKLAVGTRQTEGAGSRRDPVAALVAELAALGCADPAVNCEVPDPATGEVLVLAEACWPEGLQPGQGSPVVLRLDAAEAGLARLRELGYQVFTSAGSLRSHVRRQNGRGGGRL